MKQTFYRVEDLDQMGPYRGEVYVPMGMWVYDKTGKNRHPLPPQDTLLRQNAEHLFVFNSLVAGDYFSGFNSRKQFRKWFYTKQALKQLKEAGFSLSIYKGEGYVGEAQALFKLKEAKLVKRLPLI